jgi:2-C-methyl-D-erythritol 2,4-cyclodiphosphate synthase
MGEPFPVPQQPNSLFQLARAASLPDMVHMGIGYDIHPLVTGRKLVLGGVEIPHSHGLEGHSDADALMHAVCDAILGAMGEPDIGHYFKNTDPRWQRAPSKIFLQEAARQVGFHQGRLINVDATIIAEEPKVAQYIQQMKFNIAQALSLNVRRIGIKATTNETSMSIKAEISWKRRTETGEKLQFYARRFGGEWRFHVRSRRFEDWQPLDPRMIRERYPEAHLP